MKRYALCGTHGTGKTTLLSDLTPHLEKLEIKPVFNTSNARKLFEIGEQINDKGGDFVQYVVQASHVSRFADINWFADRCVIDGWAYMRAARRAGKVSGKCWDVVEHLMNVFVPLYTQIFYTPIEFEMENDGIRKVDTDYQKEVDEYIQRIVLELDNVTIIKGNRDERLSSVLKYIV